jgi:hypothetical protein
MVKSKPKPKPGQKPIFSFFGPGPRVIDLSRDSDDDPILSVSNLPTARLGTELQPAEVTATKRPATQLPDNIPAKLLKENAVNVPPESSAVLAAASSYDSDVSRDDDSVVFLDEQKPAAKLAAQLSSASSSSVKKEEDPIVIAATSSSKSAANVPIIEVTATSLVVLAEPATTGASCYFPFLVIRNLLPFPFSQILTKITLFGSK